MGDKWCITCLPVRIAGMKEIFIHLKIKTLPSYPVTIHLLLYGTQIMNFQIEENLLMQEKYYTKIMNLE